MEDVSTDSCPLPIYSQSEALSDPNLDSLSGGMCNQLKFGELIVL